MDFENIKKLISEDEIDKGILALKKIIPISHRNSLILLSQRYYKWKKDYQLGIISGDSIQNKIVYDLLEFISELESGKDPSIALNSKQGFDVVILYSDEDQKFIQNVILKLKDFGLSIYEDKYEYKDKWGGNFLSHVEDVISNYSDVIVIFNSLSFRKRFWDNFSDSHNEESVFEPYLEQIKFYTLDDSSIPSNYSGNQDNILDLRLRTVEEVAVRIAKCTDIDDFYLPDYPDDIAEINIRRTSNELRKFDWVTFDVYCNDTKIGTLRANEIFNFKVQPGIYTLLIKYYFTADEFDGVDEVIEVTYSGKSPSLDFHLKEGTNYFECGFEEYNKRLFGLITTSYDVKLFLRSR